MKMPWFEDHQLKRGNVRLLLWATAIGLMAGIGATAFRFAATYLPQMIWTENRDLVLAVAQSPLWLRILIPILGSLLAGLMLMLGTRWAGPARGWDILEAVALRDGILHLRSTLVRCASSLITVASAGAVGREGPMVLFASTIASFAGRWFGASTRHLRILVGCGAAAGIACAYNAPIGAALFTMEILFGNFAMEVFAPLVFSSVLATLIARGVFGNLRVLQVANYTMASGWEIFPYTALGILGGITAALFLQALRTSSKMFRRSRLPRPIAMSAVGLILGIVIVRFPDVVGNGRESIAHLFESDWTISLILILLGLRLLLTSLTVGSGAVGGVFTPTLFLGAALGDAVGSIFHGLFPAVAAVPKAYALVGMGALLAGTTHAPLMAVLMIFEMTLDYNLVLPLLLASAVASLVAKGISSESVYTEALNRKRGEIPLEFGTIAAMRVRDLIRSDQATVPPNLPLPQVLEEFIAARRNHLYVVDAEGAYLGAIRIRDLSRALREQGDPQTVLAVDLADRDFQTAIPAESLDRILERFWMEESERLPVLEDRESGRLIGTISQRDILELYSLEALHRRSSVVRFDSQGGRAPTVVELPADHQIDDMPLPPSLVGMTLAESRFRERYDLAMLLIRRKSLDGNEIRIIPEGKTKFLTGDRLIVFGSLDKLAALNENKPAK